jgi:hypothetical protein
MSASVIRASARIAAILVKQSSAWAAASSGIVPSAVMPSWPAQNTVRACGGTSTAWLYLAKGGCMPAGV